MRFVVLILSVYLLISEFASAEIKINGFSDVTFTDQKSVVKTKNQSDSKNSANGFTGGQLDLLLSTSLGEKTSFLGETLFQALSPNSAQVSLERLIWTYDKWDELEISVGRFHPELGYWVEGYRHASWLQTPIIDPKAYTPNISGEAILPTHNMGIEFKGLLRQVLGYQFSITDGRLPPQTNSDSETDVIMSKKTKAGHLLVYLHTPVDGLRLGGSYMVDQLLSKNITSSSGEVTGQTPQGTEYIQGLFLAYVSQPWELIAESYFLKHRFKNTNDISLQTSFAQASFEVRKSLVPYVRAEFVTGDRKQDDLYLSIPMLQKEEIYTLGIRFELTETTAIKAEYTKDWTRVADSTTSIANMRFNVCWGF